MKRGLTAAYLLLLLLSYPSLARQKPNIVLFFIDDLGWSDLGFRNRIFESPNIDTLAEEGLSFEQAYIACPTCSPSRATLLTGKHPARLKLVRHIAGGPRFPEFDKYGRTEQPFNYWPTDPAHFPCRNWLPLEHTTYAEALKKLGYYNLFVGKWHLGHEPYHPVHQGFDRQIGASNYGHPRSYYPPYFKNSEVLAHEKERYLTDTLTDETVRFIEQYDEDRPFMISFWKFSMDTTSTYTPARCSKLRDTNSRCISASHFSAIRSNHGTICGDTFEKSIGNKTFLIFFMITKPHFGSCLRFNWNNERS